MVGDPAVIKLSQSDAKPCAHHWQIETPAGETSEGTCKLCGATRSFLNYTHHQAMAPTRRGQARRESAS